MAETYSPQSRGYTIKGDPEELVELCSRVMNKVTKDGWVILAASACFESRLLYLGAIPWTQHPNALGFWHRGLEIPYEQVSYDLQLVLDASCIS